MLIHVGYIYTYINMSEHIIYLNINMYLVHPLIYARAKDISVLNRVHQDLRYANRTCKICYIANDDRCNLL